MLTLTEMAAHDSQSLGKLVELSNELAGKDPVSSAGPVGVQQWMNPSSPAEYRAMLEEIKPYLMQEA